MASEHLLLIVVSVWQQQMTRLQGQTELHYSILKNKYSYEQFLSIFTFHLDGDVQDIEIILKSMHGADGFRLFIRVGIVTQSL